MSQIVSKFQELGLTLPACPAPVAAYVPATRFGDTIIVSGQLSSVIVSGQLPSVKGDFSAFTGIVPNQISVEKAKEAAQICFLNNIAAALTQLKNGETLRLVQIQGFVQSANDFHDQPIVLNGASELAVQILGENGKHARTAVGVSTLPKNVAVEISCTFQAIKE